MKDNTINILKLILGLTILLLPAAAIFLIVLNADWFNALPLVLRNSVGFGAIAFSVIVLVVVLTKTHLFDGALKDAFKKDQIKFERWDDKNSKEIESLSIDRTKYKNKTKIYSQLNRLRGLPFILPSSFLLIYYILRSEQYNIVLTFFLVTTAVLVYNYFGRIIKISPKGIRSASLFRNQLIKWDKIKTIGISGGIGKTTSDLMIWVYVSTRELKNKHHITSGKESKGYIAFKFRAKMIHHILCYYDREIINLHNVRRWRTYIKKYGFPLKQEEANNNSF